MKIVSIVGARPQFIKCAPVSRELRQVAEEIIVHTGQHYDESMSSVFFRDLRIPQPDYHLGVGSGTHGQQTGKMLNKIEQVLLTERPDCVLVYGDTNSTLAGALAAAKLHIPVIHVEAGLRSFNRRMPEETNRVLTDHVAALLLCPTETAMENLQREGITAGIHLVGDVMYDALLENVEIAKQTSTIPACLGVTSKQFILTTVHRAENTDQPKRLEGIMKALFNLVESGHTIVFPVHPRTRKQLDQVSVSRPDRLLLTDPLSYLDMVLLESMASLILTDSGGVQKEGYWLRVPCITLRDETEWIETVESGWNRLVGADTQSIVKAVENTNPGCSIPWRWQKGEASQSTARIISQAKSEHLVYR